ncbi:FAD/NAD(P)-binding domain-containing protein [Artomyces pyxidatus]|uniref:FAD/NAD(P)-binding domain-containing protein n=1 Tax=Artomyces pyxidatus TaxID=48021 RepID=A0ACB8SWD7_9AGAM|nr:FAD/NAD(P)-binding domain-containing protein [Artomyces pyxidatus]
MAAAPPVLPTLQVLNVSLPPEEDSKISPETIASEWLGSFSQALSNPKDLSSLEKLFLPSVVWKDVLALTWDFRSLTGLPSVQTALSACLGPQKFSVRALTAEEQESAKGTYKPLIVRMFPDCAWIQFGFAVETEHAAGVGVARLVPTAEGPWKGFTVYTTLEKLKAFPEIIGAARPMTHDVEWAEHRERELAFVDAQPDVVIIGGGHTGLEIAARLKYLGVSALILEKNARVGDNWRNRYDALCLHDPVWFDHMAYIPFPTTWPVFPSAKKLADWLESYANTLELNVWTSANTHSIIYDKKTQTWTLDVTRSGSEKRHLKSKFVIFAHGSGGGVPVTPNIKGKEVYEGKVYHSSEFKSGKDFKGKKAIVVGAGNSGHDIAQDFFRHGADVTMFQRSETYILSTKAAFLMTGSLYSENGPPTAIADVMMASTPGIIGAQIFARVTGFMASTVDKEIYDGLEKAGFKTGLGPGGGGLFALYFTRGGGYYIDVGASELIANGSIKVKHGGEITSFTKNGLTFDDGKELEADVIVFATGYGDSRQLARELLEPKVADALKPMWGPDEEGELRGAWRYSGHQGLYFAQGNYSIARTNSTLLALQIKAELEGVLGERYTLEKQHGRGA